jgi:hypothetical protein
MEYLKPITNVITNTAAIGDTIISGGSIEKDIIL